MRELASAYTHLEGIIIDDKERELSEEDLKRIPFVKPEPKGCANLFQGKVKIPKYESATWGTRQVLLEWIGWAALRTDSDEHERIIGL